MFVDISSKVQKKLGPYLGQDGLQGLYTSLPGMTSTNKYVILCLALALLGLGFELPKAKS